MKVAVLGAGLAGLSAGYKLAESGVDIEVIEAEDRVGGMAVSFTDGEFTYDLGPHRFHSTDDKVNDHLKELMGDGLVNKVRVSRILLEKRFFDYPLRVGNAIFNMPPLTTLRIMIDYGFVKLKNLFIPSPDDSFETWVLNRFGRKLYDLYFRVYTEKTWGIPCTQISADWASQRISLLSLWDTIVKTLFKKGDAPRTYVSKFFYPAKGGIGGISESYAQSIRENGGKIHLSRPVDSVELSDNRIKSIGAGDKKWEIADDDIVFSTLPLTSMISFMPTGAVPKKVHEAVNKLIFRSLVFVQLMVSADKVSDDHWIYLPEPKFISNRLSESKNFNVTNAPDGKTLVTFELTCQKGDDLWNAEDEDLKGMAVEDFKKTGLLPSFDIIGFAVHREEWAYPIYDLEYKDNLDTVLDWFKTIENLNFFGRNGLFRYNNMDHSVSMGLIAASSVTDESIDYMAVATEQNWFG